MIDALCMQQSKKNNNLRDFTTEFGWMLHYEGAVATVYIESFLCFVTAKQSRSKMQNHLYIATLGILN